MSFVHLHVHSDYSLLDGAARCAEMARRARELHMPALALTDHGNLHGAIEFYHACLKEGVKPIIGMEAYVAPGSRLERSSKHGLSDAAYHLILLARDMQGWMNLVQLSTIGHLQGFYYRPRLDMEVLEKHASGLTALSGCLSGEIPSLIMKNELPMARQKAEEFQRVFGKENFYLEMQDHGIPAQKMVNRELKEIAKAIGAPLVATNDSHYLEQGMAEAHAVLLCVQTATNLDDPNRMRFDGEDFYLKSAREMQEAFSSDPEALANTLAIAERCNLVFDKPSLALPKFEVPPEHKSEDAYLEHLCRGALPAKYPDAAEAKPRLERELEVIAKLGFSGYFLTVRDFIAWARSKGIRVGPGRGSAAGSIVSYLLDITQLDPIRTGLLFERFLNPERVSPPDIDVDFADHRRDEVIAYVAEKYGRERVASIITFGTLAARAAVRDVGRALNYSYGEVDAVAKMIPMELDITLERALESSPELRAAAADPRVRRLLDISAKLEGLARNASKHAAGIVIAPFPLIERVPLCLDKSGGDGAAVVTQFDMGSLEKIGLLKMDFLGLRTLRVIDTALALLGPHAPDIDHLPDSDPATFDMLSKGEAHGVFQLESAGMRDLLKRFKPRNLEDLDQLIALYRPGPMEMIGEYIERREGRLKPDYHLPQLEPLLKPTNGVIIYQEQVMRVAMEVGGLSAAASDLMRRAMSKKDPELLERHRREFLDGAKGRGVEEALADRLFDLLAKFAGYGFNKSHSAAYALVAYQTAWLKAHHPAEFLCAVLSSESGNADRVAATLNECRRLGIAVLPPDLAESGADFALSSGAIRFGLAAVKNVGLAAVESIIEERQKNGPFKDYADLLARADPRQLNARMAESLVKAGAFDSLSPGPGSRSSLLAALPQLAEDAARRHKDLESGQESLFGSGSGSPGALEGLPKVPEWPESVKLGFEKEMLGFYVSGHPLRAQERAMRLLKATDLAKVKEMNDGALVLACGVALGVKQQLTKRQEPFARVLLEDFSGSAEILVWPKVLEACKSCVKKDAMLAVAGRVDSSGEEAKVSAVEVMELKDAVTRLGKVLHLKLRAEDEAEAGMAADWLKAHPGKVPVVMHWEARQGEVVQKLKTGVDLRDLEGLNGMEVWVDWSSV